MFRSWAVLCGLCVSVFSYNIDTQSPYVIKGNQDGSFFGFSTALHFYGTGSQRLRYILVGAPKANWTTGLGAGLASPGAVYKCPIPGDVGDPSSENLCSSQVTYLTENNSPNDRDEDKSNQWLGVNVQSSDNYVSACAHRYMWLGPEADKRLPIGKCTVIGDSLSNQDLFVTKKTLYPCKDGDTLTSDSKSCQVGSSQTQYPLDNDNAYLFYGAPGMDSWEGSAYLSEHLDDVKGSKKIDDLKRGLKDFNRYNGYAVAVCAMSGADKPVDFITSAPRANNYLGMLYFFNSDNQNTNERTLLRNSELDDDLTGDQMGAYYGYSLACGDLNNDGYADLLVSAPWYSIVTSAKSSIISVGRVYVYNGDPTKVVSNANRPTILESPSADTSAFGLGMAYIGDINKDSYADFAIGAPYENDQEGAVYIYHGSINGIKKIPAQAIKPTGLGSLGVNLRTFGWSISAGKDMDDNLYPDMVVGSYTSDRAVFLRSLPIVDLDIQIIIPEDPVDLELEDKRLPPSQFFPGTTLKICFTPNVVSTKSYEVMYSIFLDYKQDYAPRAFFQASENSERQFVKKGSKVIDMSVQQPQCTNTWTVYLKKKSQMFDDKTYIEVNMAANIRESATFARRAVLKQEQVARAKGKIVIKSICESVTGICQCDIKLNEPSVQYFPSGYNSVVLDNVNQVVVKYEVENLGPHNAHMSTLKVLLPPKVYFIRRTPVDDQTEADVSPIACSEVEEGGKNYVECYLPDPLPRDAPTKFGISLDTTILTDPVPLTLEAEVNIGSPSEESPADEVNNRQSITVDVGEQANLVIRGTAATQRNAIKPDPTLVTDKAFLRSVKLEVRHTVSVLIKESDEAEGDEDGISDIVVEINWPMRDHNGEYLLYLSEVYVKDNQIKDNFLVDSNAIDPDCLFDYNSNCVKRPTARYVSAVGTEETEGYTTEEEEERAANAKILNTDCSVPDPGCVKFNVTINLLKAGSINMKDLAFEMRSIIWLPNILNKGDFNATSTARIVSVGQNLVIPPGSDVSMKTQVSEEITKEQPVLWIIVGSVIGGIVILAVLIVVLWKVGFFKRKMPPKDGSGM